MKIPLRNFEQLIDPAILKRGLTYFKKGRVQEGEGIDGELLFFVQGTEEYEVSVKIKQETIEDFNCDCPYVDGPVCKHVVAVIFYLTQDILHLTNDNDTPKPLKSLRGRPRAKTNEIPDVLLKTSSRVIELNKNPSNESKKDSTAIPGRSKKVSVNAQIESIIEQLSSEEIKHYLLRHILSDKSQQADFLATFAQKNTHESADTYGQQIKRILSSAKDRSGFIDYRSASKVGNHVFAITSSGMMHAEKGNYRSAIMICKAVMEEMLKALDFADDSNGDIGSNLEMAYGILYVLSQKSLPEELRKHFFDYAINVYQRNLFEGWDWHLGMLRIALNLSQSDQEMKRVLDLANQPSLSEYDLMQRQSLIYSTLLKQNDNIAAQDFLERHSANPDLRKIALQNAFSNKAYEQVKQLAQAGIIEDSKSKPGLLSDWYDWLIKVAEVQGDTSQVIEYARSQLLEFGRNKETYIQIIRKHTPDELWIDTYRHLIEDMSVSQNWQTRDLIPKLLLEEKDWVNLLGYLQFEAKTEVISFDRLIHFGQHLVTNHQQEIGALFSQCLISAAHQASNRKDYIRLTKDLRAVKKLGYVDMVKELAQSLRNTYKHRPAMLEELHKL